MRLTITILCVFGLLASGLSSANGHQGRSTLNADARKIIADWLIQPELQRGNVPDAVVSLAPMSKAESRVIHRELWKLYQHTGENAGDVTVLPAPTRLGDGSETRLQPHTLKTGGKSMPFVFIERGKSTGLKPMFIALHGGGSSKVATPHGWPVNTREWQTQIQLATTIYPDNAVYFVPRMADDRDGRWYYSYCQDAYERVIRESILLHNVDPDRVYLIGISEGAYTAYRLGAFMADRWAGAGSMAGGEPLGNAPPENMRNIAFRADIGERDTMFDRIGLNRRYGKVLEKLKGDDAQGYRYRIEVHAGRGHGIDYRPCPRWLIEYKRDPWPSRVRWVNIDVHGRRRMRSYWLALDEPPDGRLEFDAQMDQGTNTITVNVGRRDREQVHRENGVSFRVYLNDMLLDLDRPVRVVRNGDEVFAGNVTRRAEVLLRTLAERGDPQYGFPTEIRIGAD